MEEQNNQNLEQQELEQKETEQIPKETINEVNVQTTTKKPFPKIAIGAIALAVVAIIVVLIIALGGNKDGNIICDSCGASILESVKFCPDCGNTVSLPNNNNNGNTNSNNCVHDWIWESSTVTCNSDGYDVYKCYKCNNTKKEVAFAYGCYDLEDDGYCNDCNSYIGNIYSAEWISNRSISYVDDIGGFRFCFALMNEEESYIACNATVEMSIVNDLGETVYEGTKYVTTADYGDWYNIYEEWYGTAVCIYDEEITPGLVEEGTFYYTVIAGESWFEYSLDIYDLPTYTPTYTIGETWVVNGEWEFTIDSVTTHNACRSPGDYNNNNLAQYVMITYSYKNIGFDYYSSGINFGFTEFDVYDEEYNIGEYYICNDAKDSNYVSINGKCNNAQLVFGLPTSSDSINIYVGHYTDYGYLEVCYNVQVGDCAHNEVIDSAIEATCDTDGKTQGSHCSICGEVIKKQTTINAKGHNFVNDKCTICNSYDTDSDTYKYNVLKKKADAIAFSCAETVLRNQLKNPNTLQILSEKVIDSDDYFRYYVKIEYSAQNNVGGYVTDTVYILFKVNSVMDGTFTYYVDSLGIKYPVTNAEKTEFGWDTKPDDFSLDAFNRFDNPEEVSLKLIVAYPNQYKEEYVRIKEEVVISSNDIKDKSFHVYISTGDGKYDFNTDVDITVFYRMCDNLEELILLDADYQKIIIEGYVKVYSNSTDAYIEAYNISFAK